MAAIGLGNPLGNPLARQASTQISADSFYANTWTSQTGSGSRGWRSICISEDGMKLAAGTTGSNIYTSTDGGITWTSQAGSLSDRYDLMACSSDGSKIVAARNASYPYLSTDSGVTWNALTGIGVTASGAWNGLCMSEDGQFIGLCDNNTSFYYSTDGGTNWTTRTVTGSTNVASVSCNSTGSSIACIEGSATGKVYISTNSGTSFSAATVPEASAGRCIATDGTKIVAGYVNGNTYISLDFGTSWKITGIRGQVYVFTSTDRSLFCFSGTDAGAGCCITPIGGDIWAWVSANTTFNGTTPFQAAISATKVAVACDTGYIYTSP